MSGGQPGLHFAGTVALGTFRLELDFTAQPGEVLGILGPNGAGKSTLLRALAGLVALTEGSVTLGETVLDDVAAGHFLAADKRPIGLVFQSYRLFPHLSVRDNVAFAARSAGANRRDASTGAEEWLARLGVAELADRKPRQLSGGQAQRVALARALAADPGLLLLDEPLAALDARTRLEVRAELRRHLSDFPGPTLLVTHDPLEAMVLTDRLLVIEDGRLVQQGTAAQVARRPATQYVARLVGLNLYAGTRIDEVTVRLDGGGTLFVARSSFEAAGPPLAAAEHVLVALRPAAIALHTTRPDHASPRNVWAGTITGLELLVDRVRVQIDGAPPALVDITPAAVSELDLATGGTVWLSAKATDLDVYPDSSPGAARGSRVAPQG